MKSESEQTTVDVADRTDTGASRPRVSLVLFHRDGARIVPLPPDSSLVVGRARPADVAIADPSLSRRHARFTRDRDAIWVEDLGSTNGTKLRGRAINERTRVKPGEEVTIGAVTVSTHHPAPTEPELEELESHDRFRALLEDEIVRARNFRRPLSLLMVRVSKGKPGKLGTWCPRVRRLLRPVDRIAVYGPRSIWQVRSLADVTERNPSCFAAWPNIPATARPPRSCSPQ